MSRSVRPAVLATVLFASLPALLAQPVPRRPHGIYAVVNIEELIKKERTIRPSITPAELEAYFVGLYGRLLDNPAVSGLAIWVNWDALNPNPADSSNAYDWSWLDDPFRQVSGWNSRNPTKPPKTIQLVPLPGFQTPHWVLDQIPSCDDLFRGSTAPRTCGSITVDGFVEGRGVRVLPLPWNPVYRRSWRTFLTALAGRFASNSAFVSISVAGPTASSEEMILPSNGNTPAQRQLGGLLPNAVWLRLLAFQFPERPAYQRSDQAFIDEWKAAIDMYAAVFDGVTLVVTTGAGLPNLGGRGFTVPAAFSSDCPHPNMDCAAETTTLAYFEQPSVGRANAKAVQEDGMEAARVGNFNLGVQGIKLVSRGTAGVTANGSRVMGGAQFNSSFSNFALVEGCPVKFPPRPAERPSGCSIPPDCTVQACIPASCIPQACLAPGVGSADLAGFKTFRDVPGKYLLSPEQAAYNVLRVFFDGTPAAAAFGATPGSTPLSYLQIYAVDFLYAEAHADAPAAVVQPDGATLSITAQNLLNLASAKLSAIGPPRP